MVSDSCDMPPMKSHGLGERVRGQIGFTRQKYGFQPPFLGLFRLLRGDRVMFGEDICTSYDLFNSVRT